MDFRAPQCPHRPKTKALGGKLRGDFADPDDRLVVNLKGITSKPLRRLTSQQLSRQEEACSDIVCVVITGLCDWTRISELRR